MLDISSAVQWLHDGLSGSRLSSLLRKQSFPRLRAVGDGTKIALESARPRFVTVVEQKVGSAITPLYRDHINSGVSETERHVDLAVSETEGLYDTGHCVAPRSTLHAPRITHRSRLPGGLLHAMELYFSASSALCMEYAVLSVKICIYFGWRTVVGGIGQTIA